MARKSTNTGNSKGSRASAETKVYLENRSALEKIGAKQGTSRNTAYGRTGSAANQKRMMENKANGTASRTGYKTGLPKGTKKSTSTSTRSKRTTTSRTTSKRK